MELNSVDLSAAITESRGEGIKFGSFFSFSHSHDNLKIANKTGVWLPVRV